jgi:hypothetical protein
MTAPWRSKNVQSDTAVFHNLLANYQGKTFLAIAYRPSYPALDWLKAQTEGRYAVQELGEPDGVKDWEFIPAAH